MPLTGRVDEKEADEGKKTTKKPVPKKKKSKEPLRKKRIEKRDIETITYSDVGMTYILKSKVDVVNLGTDGYFLSLADGSWDLFVPYEDLYMKSLHQFHKDPI